MLPALDRIHAEPTLPPRSFVQLEFSLLVYGLTCPDSFLPVPDILQLGFLMLLRTLLHVGPMTFAYGMA